MESPLTKEQIEKINEISKLPVKQQQQELNKFIKTLNQEQLEFLKAQQQTECLFCGIVDGKVFSNKVYEDDLVMAVLDIIPANKGHILVFPKKHYSVLSQIEDVGHLFNIVNSLTRAVYDGVSAEGTNIYIANGICAGQNVDHVIIHIIPRFKDDGINFKWTPKKIGEDELNNISKDIKSKLVVKRENVKEEEVERVEFDEEERIP